MIVRTAADVGKRIRQLRDLTKFSQGRVERETGLLRCYISRVEHGHTLPNVQTLVEFAHGFGLTLAEFFDGTLPSKRTPRRKREAASVETAQPQQTAA